MKALGRSLYSTQSIFYCLCLAVLFSACEKQSLPQEEYPIKGALIAHYPFSGDASDHSGSRLHGKVVGAKMVADRSGAADEAYYFDGKNDYIEVPRLGQDRFEGDFTISVWCSFSSLQEDYPSLVAGENNYLSLSGAGPEYRQNEGRIAAYQGYSYLPDVRRIPNFFSKKKVKLGEYLHIAFMKKQGTAYLYLNGVLENTVSVEPHIPLLDGEKLYFGTGYLKTSKQFFHGYIDDIAIYKKALSHEEIKELAEE